MRACTVGVRSHCNGREEEGTYLHGGSGDVAHEGDGGGEENRAELRLHDDRGGAKKLRLVVLDCEGTEDRACCPSRRLGRTVILCKAAPPAVERMRSI